MSRLFATSRYPIGVNDEDDPNAIPNAVPIVPDQPKPQPAPQPITATPIAAATPKTPIQTKYDQDQAELQRLQNSKSGITQLTHPVDALGNPDPNKHPGFWKKFGSVAARIGDVAGTALFPGVTAQIPGTELHHDVLLNQQQGRVNSDLATEKEQKAIEAMDSPKPKEEHWEVAKDYTGPNGEPVLVETNSGQMHVATPLGGVKLKPPKLTDSEQPLGGKVQQLNDAMTARYQVLHPGQPLPQQYQIPANATSKDYDRIDKALESEERAISTKAQQETSNEMRRQSAALAREAFQFRKDQAEDKANKPTADEQRRADLAKNMNENLDAYEDILKRRPDLFGPFAGRVTGMKETFGTEDPDIAKLKAIEEQMGMAMVGAHAMRNAQHVATAANAIVNGRKNSPEATAEAIKAARNSLQTFINDANRGGESKSGSQGGGKDFSVQAPNGKTYHFNDQAALDKFKKDAGIQ